jgi:hypothetical protein
MKWGRGDRQTPGVFGRRSFLGFRVMIVWNGGDPRASVVTGGRKLTTILRAGIARTAQRTQSGSRR